MRQFETGTILTKAIICTFVNFWTSCFLLFFRPSFLIARFAVFLAASAGVTLCPTVGRPRSARRCNDDNVHECLGLKRKTRIVCTHARSRVSPSLRILGFLWKPTLSGKLHPPDPQSGLNLDEGTRPTHIRPPDLSVPAHLPSPDRT